MPNSDSSGGIYTPIPQTITDSDSEEEILNSAKYTMNSKSKNHIITENGTSLTGFPSPSDCEDANGIFHGDNVAILHETVQLEHKMSPIRKCCFIASLLVCVLALVIFLFVIPCSDELSCPANTERIKTHNWIRNYEKIELKGVINVVSGLRGKSRNLVFMYRGDKLFPEFNDSDKRRNGIISLIGSSGKISWYDQMINEPKSIDCSLIDADKNGAPDCLVIDEFGQLECINPISGQWLWHSPIYDTKNIVKHSDLLDFPLVIPDLDMDGVNDLFFVTSFGEKRHNKFVIISGATGQLVGDSYEIKECLYIHKLQIDADFTIKFNCINENSEQQKTRMLQELYGSIKKGEVLDLKKIKRKRVLAQHKFFGQRKNTEVQRTINSVRGKQLIVENRGKCPENCSVTVQLIEQKNGRDKVLWNITGEQMYGMQPVRLTFNNSGVDSRSTINGFVIKFWEWSQNDYENRIDRMKREEFNVFSNVLVEKKTWVLPDDAPVDDLERKKRNVNQTFKPGTYKTKMRLLKETVKLIVFNTTDTKIENTSQSNVIQFCREEISDKNNIVCQPDLNYQENSLLIADLDEDGSQELVSYYSTFVKSDEAKDLWRLKTFVQLLRLESELPKLYSVDIKNK